MKNFYLFVLLILIGTFIFSCNGKKNIPQPTLEKNQLITKVLENNPYKCNLKTKAIFFIKDRFDKIKFKGYIIKECDNSFILNILGPFNQLFYKVVLKTESLMFLNQTKVSKEETSF